MCDFSARSLKKMMSFLPPLVSISIFLYIICICSSGKCQILHWRQGHKDECCPPTANMLSREEHENFGMAASQKQLETLDAIPSVASSIRDDDVGPNVYAEGKHTFYASSSGSSRGRSELPSNIAPSNEGKGSNTADRLVRPTSVPVTTDVSGKKVRSKKIKPSTSPSPQFTNSVTPVEGTSRANKLAKVKSIYISSEGNCISPQLAKGKMALNGDNPPSKLGSRKTTGGTASPELLAKDTSKSTGLSSQKCSRLNYVDKGGEDDSKLCKGKDRSLSSTMHCLSSASGEQPAGNSKSLLPENSSSIPNWPQNSRHGLKTSVRKVVQQLLVAKPLKSYLLGSENEMTVKYSDKVFVFYSAL